MARGHLGAAHRTHRRPRHRADEFERRGRLGLRRQLAGQLGNLVGVERRLFELPHPAVDVFAKVRGPIAAQWERRHRNFKLLFAVRDRDRGGPHFGAALLGGPPVR
jgi:hypothetical protein